MTLSQKTAFLFSKPAALSGSGLHLHLAYIIAKYLHCRTSRFGIKRIVHSMLATRRYRLHLKTIHDCTLMARFSEAGDYHAWNEVFVERVYEMGKVSFTPELIVDAGAHIGTFTLYAHSFFPGARKICVEPNSSNYEILSKNICTNNVPAALHNCALADFEGAGAMTLGSGIGSHLLLGTDNGQAVCVKKLSSLIDLTGVRSLVLKCDTEGMELPILSDILPHVPSRTVIFVETHGGRSETQRIQDLLENVGFRFDVIRSRKAYEDCVAVRG